MSREIDISIAEEIFGIKVKHLKEPGGFQVQYQAEDHKCNDPIVTDYGVAHWELKKYSTDISAAWEIIKELTKNDWRVDIIVSEHGGTDVKVSCNAEARGVFVSDLMEGKVLTTPEAICVVALRTKEVK